MIEKINLKTEYNWRGDIAELLAKYNVKGLRTKGYDYQKPSWICDEHNVFLKKHWVNIDLFRVDQKGSLILFEVKSRTFGVHRRPDLTEANRDMYGAAIELGIIVRVIMVYFYDDWKISFELKDYDERDFRINNGGRMK